MRRLFFVVFALTVLGSPANAGEVICGKDWISFQPLRPEAFSKEPGLNTYLVRKSDIRRGQAARRGPLSQFGYVKIAPLEDDPRTYHRVTKAAYLAIQACLMGSAR